MLRELEGKPLPVRLWAYIRLSGPGWLQSALTLGGGSLSGSLYLGVLAGFSLLWLQPLAMILGIMMLAAIGYVTLSTGERPFRLINRHVNPALGWGWLIASMAANMIWCLPQYSLATGVLRQNLAPDLLGTASPFGNDGAQLLIVGVIFVLCTAVTWSYGSGHWGVRLYEALLKVLVAVVVACFVGVVVQLSLSGRGLDWSALFAGLVPDFGALFRPADAFAAKLTGLQAANPAAAAHWSNLIVANQRDVAMAAFATAVGINMTFLLPYSMLGRGWGREHRGLSVFDLSTGMFIPFFLATTCVVVSAAHQFHAVPQPGLATPAVAGEVDANGAQRKEFDKLLAVRTAAVPGDTVRAERDLAAMLVKRDAQNLSGSLAPLLGDRWANIVFGIGVLGMALSTITLLMLVSGFVVCEVLDLPSTGWPFRLGTLFAATGVLGPFLAGDQFTYLAVPTSVAGLTLLPIAYLTFLLMMNNRRLLGDDVPRGGKRWLVNLALGLSTGVAFFASGWAIVSKIGVVWLIAIVVTLAVLLVMGALVRRRSTLERS